MGTIEYGWQGTEVESAADAAEVAAAAEEVAAAAAEEVAAEEGQKAF